MLHKTFHFLVFLLICTSILNAQQSVHELTLSIVDSNQSKYYQAKQIYSWITGHIQYDVKAYQRNEALHYTVPEILKKKHGLCNEYALLFATMCKEAEIEAYSISAYSKYPDYRSGKLFLRTEHILDVFLYDSVWHFVDPTFGSGYISGDAALFRKILTSITKLPAPLVKFKFVNQPDSSWFDIPPQKLLERVYPLDPKWFSTDRPFSFDSFERDSVLERTDYPDYYNNIEAIRGISPENILKEEGINGHRFNSHNYFDLANGYVDVATTYYLERDIIRTNVSQFERYSNEFGIAQDAMKKHIALNDSLYRKRKAGLKELSSRHRRINNKIDSKARSAKSSFRSGNRQIMGKTSSYHKKLESFLLKAEKTKLYIVPEGRQNDSIKTDKNKAADLLEEITAIKLPEAGFQYKADSLFLLIDTQLLEDALLDDSINFKNYLFADIIHHLNSAIELNIEDSIRAYVDTLVTTYFEIGDLLVKKKSSKNDMRAKSKEYFTYSGQLQGNLKKQSTLLKKLYRESNFSDSVRLSYNDVLSRLINSYEQSMKYTRKLDNHNMLQSDSRKVNLQALKYQNKILRREFRSFTAWYTMTFEKEEQKYLSEKNIAKQILSEAQSNKRLVDSKLKKYYKSLEKK
jgi:hypothetical protein